VLLVRIRDLAIKNQFRTMMIEANESKAFPSLLVPKLKSILFELSTKEKGKHAVRRGLRMLKGFAAGLKVSVGEISVELGVEPEEGAADSGQLEADLPNMFVAIGEAAKACGVPVLLLIDEMQYLRKDELSAVIMSMHQIAQHNLPMLLVGAGLPQVLALAGDSKSYAERLFHYPPIGELDPVSARDAIVNPALDEGARIDADAVDQILLETGRYPYFLQQWGHEAWNIAENDRILLQDVNAARDLAIKKLDDSFFRVRFERCTPSEKRYMRALAELGEGPHRSGEVAERLGLKTTSVGPTRGNLIRKGMIYAPQHGDTAFTVPLFDQYMRRVMPELE